MARYIDADSLYCRVKTHTNPYGKPTLDYQSGVKVLDMINQEPTADVVPRAEVDKLTIELEAMRTAANSYKMRYERANPDRYVLEDGKLKLLETSKNRREYLAREIFNKITTEVKSTLLEAMKEQQERGNFYYDDSLVAVIYGKISALEGIVDFVTNLEHEYTGGNSNE